MTLILAADTSTNINTVALCRVSGDGRVSIAAEIVVDAARRHAERIVDTIDWVLTEGKAALSDVDLLAITNGPGSFTGLRIGVATWKGLAFGAGLPLIAVPTLDALARVANADRGIVCALLDARMNEVFAAAYRMDNGQAETLLDARVCPVEAILEALPAEDVLFLGDGAERYKKEIETALPNARFAPPANTIPRASAVAAEAWALRQAGAPSDAANVAPVYLRKAQAQMLRDAKKVAAP